jgi:class 3 adenylate cyclase
VAEDGRERERYGAVDDVQVGVTNATVLDRHDDFARVRAFEFQVVDDDEWIAGRFKQGGAHAPNVVVKSVYMSGRVYCGAVTCPSCGTPAPAEARFCPGCGHSLGGERGDERRLVTILFADLVGYTTLAETRDPEQVKNLVDRCFQRLAADIVAHGGRVDKIVGDAIMALFGAPLAHEDDAERAVRAGLQMQRTLAEWSSELDVNFRMRVGINSGEVLVGALRAGGDYTAMGDVVNTASRLQTNAEPGQVLVGPTTHAATRDVMRYETLGLVRAKGRDEAVPAWVALEAVAPPGHRPRRVRTPLVG